MDLNDVKAFEKLDPQNMLGEIDNLPKQLQSAWELGQQAPLPDCQGVTRILISGMGGSAIGADLLAAYLAPTCQIPVIVHRDYSLPAWAHGPETLVIASSHSGNTEETLAVFEAAIQGGCRLLTVCTGGELEQRATAQHVPVWKFNHDGQPRVAVGFSFGLLLAASARMGLIPNPEKDLLEAVAGMLSQQETLRAHVPVAQNPAKRLAGQLVGRWVNVYGSGILAPVARRWKGQINEIAKAGAGFELLPEADHNALAGLENPEVLMRTMTLFLCAPSDHPRNHLRIELTRQVFMIAGLNTDVYNANGESRLAHLWTALHFGDYMAYYLAMAYGMDPTPVEALQNLKAALKATR
ncbi:MAG: bifunctional phosphoglucose/phosphomannose isomerase [Anaerolineales bacterium]|jgi:glucose/mannose-6-phosphate isomerase